MSIYRNYVIKDRDTLQGIAFRELNDINQWHNLAEFNQLEYPYIVKTDKEKMTNYEHLASVGDIIKLPLRHQVTDINHNVERLGFYNNEQVYDTILGMDIKLEPSLDTTLSYATGELVSDKRTSDIDRVIGLDNLKQSLILRLLTPYGSLLRHPDYGSSIPDMLGQPLNTDTADLLAVEIKRCISTDSRVQKVSAFVNIDDEDNIQAVAKVVPINEEDNLNIYIVKAQNGLISIK